ncbi:MAG: hypothetical protein A4E35_01933 [Methanoregula sp. PtaU1.Bin051]|nr:MAG: hypothetical protein A4E35_01933 [Methanoregula sp. PtaU1.Bin051]
MDIALFSDLADALGKVVSALNSLADIPPKERDKYRQTFNETYRLLDTVLNIVIIKLGEIRDIQDPAVFTSEVSRLDNNQEWLQNQRDFRLCYNLHVTCREARSLPKKLVGKISVNDWNALLEQIESVFQSETSVADQISNFFKELAENSQNQPPDIVKKQVNAFRDALIKERQKLIKDELELFKTI